MDELNWRQKVVANLAECPEDWVILGALFAGVEESIPPHLALRRVYASNGEDTEIGLHTARWRMFLAHVRPIVERCADGGRLMPRFQRADLVRLKPDGSPCDKCGGARYICFWPGPNQKPRYTCPACAAVEAKVRVLVDGWREVEARAAASVVPPPEVIPPPLPPPAPRAGAAKRKRPRRVYSAAAPRPPSPAPRSPSPAPLPPAQTKVTARAGTTNRVTNSARKNGSAKPVREEDPLEHAWLHLLTHLENNERDNLKLRRAMRLAFDMGVINEYQQVVQFGAAEFLRVGWPEVSTAVIHERAMRWLNLELGRGNRLILPPDMKRRRRYTPRMLASYVAASIAVIQVGSAGQLCQIADFYTAAYEKRVESNNASPPPPPKPKPSMVRRFLSATKRAVATGRWR